MIEFNKEQLEKREFARVFSESLHSQYIANIDYADKFMILWKKCADFGLLGLPVGEKYGGLEESLSNIIAIMEGIGLGSKEIGIMFSVNAHIWACVSPILQFGTEEQKDKYLPPMIDGTLIGAHAASEQEAGSDVWSMKTTYKEVKDGFILNGTKTFVTNSPFADLYIIFARKENTIGMKGLSCFIIDKRTDNIEIGKIIEKMGLELSPFTTIYINDCFVPSDRLLGKENQARKIFNYSMELERPFIFVFQIGLMERQLNECFEYAQKRTQFNQTINKFQSISNKLADMKVRLEASKLLIYKVVHELSQKKNTYLSSSIAKLYVSEALVANSMNAMEIFGGYGYVKEYGIEQNLRDSLASKIYSGTSEIQKNIISRLMQQK